MRSGRARAAVCLAILLIVPLTLAVFAFGLPPQYGETYLAALPDKWERLRSAPGPRVIVAGGSGVAFDLRSDLLERELPGYTAVNFGLYAGLGTTVMLDLALPQLREGDILVFAPELSGQTLSTFFSAEAMWQATDADRSLLAALGPEYRSAMLGAFPAFAAAKARLYRDGAAPTGDGIYARRSFSEYGDIDAPGRESCAMPLGYDENMPIRFDPALLTDGFTEKVREAAARCERAGAKLCFCFCPMNAAAIPAEEAAKLDGFGTAAEERLGLPLLLSPADSVMESGWFYDTNYHLNAAGAVAATAVLAAALKDLLGYDTPSAIEVPAMPTPERSGPAGGSSADADCFLYTITDAGARITGLSAEGAAREELVVPAAVGGVPVTGFDAAVFAGNERVRRIVVQENIRSIRDGSFDGCTALEAIVMESGVPADCTVGAGLLAGTNAWIEVPADRVSAYCTSYFWAVHAARIRARAGETPPPAPTAEETPAPAVAPGPGDVVYLGNGGTLRAQEGDRLIRPADRSHLRVNTLPGTAYFEREGYVLTGWSRSPDGGDTVGLGSRTERDEALVLYARWTEASPAEDFVIAQEDDGVRILAYRGGAAICVVPETIGGTPVRRIAAGAFRDEEIERLVLPSSLRCVEPGAFTDCVIREIVLFDSLREVSDAAFPGCTGLRTLRVNAAVSPVYSGSYYDTFADKYDRLLSLRGRRKLVLASGSSGRYGYDSAAIDAAFPELSVVNMGVYAYSNARPKLDIILAAMEPGDILLSAPEFDAIEEQFCVSDQLDAHFWAMMESDYDAAAVLDLRGYTGVFDSFAEYQCIRGGMSAKSYGVSPANYDDEGNRYAFPTYNEYGDLILPRPDRDSGGRQHENTAAYSPDAFPPETVESLNRVYERFLARDIAVYFSYTPRNRDSLTAASTPAARAALHALLRESLIVPVISDPEDYLLPGEYFWKIDSHPSTEGARLRTERIIRDLNEQLAAEGDDAASPPDPGRRTP